MGNPNGGVQSVDRAFDLLSRIADAGGDVSISELAESAPLPLPTIHRLLRTLVTSGYVRQLPSRRYGLGPGLIRLGDVASRQLGPRVQPYLAVLARELGETANMAILDGDMATYVAQVPSAQSMRMFTEIGRRVHTNASGVGKAILTLLSPEEGESVLARSGLARPTVRTIADMDAMRVEIDLVRERGYAIDDGEQEIGVRCVAVPVRDMPIPTAISVSGPTTRVDDEFETRAVPLLLEMAAAIAERREL